MGLVIPDQRGGTNNPLNCGLSRRLAKLTASRRPGRRSPPPLESHAPFPKELPDHHGGSLDRSNGVLPPILAVSIRSSNDCLLRGKKSSLRTDRPLDVCMGDEQAALGRQAVRLQRRPSAFA